MSTAVEVRGDVQTYEEEEEEEQPSNLPTQFIPAPTMPAVYDPAVMKPYEQGGGGCMGMPNAFSGSRAESAVNKKPFALIKLGHRLCGFVR